MIVLGYLVYLIFEPFLVPLAWAAILVVVFHPWHLRIARRWGNSGAAAVSTVAVACALIFPALGLALLFVREAFQAALGMQTAFAQGHLPWATNAWSWPLRIRPVAPGVIYHLS